MAKASLRNIAATIDDVHRFFTDEKTLMTGVDLREGAETLRAGIVSTAAAFKSEMKGVSLMHAQRLEWDNDQALLLERSLRDFQGKMRVAVSAKPALEKVVVGYGIDRLTTGILTGGINFILNAEGARNPGPYREDPFTGIVNNREIDGPIGRKVDAGMKAALA